MRKSLFLFFTLTMTMSLFNDLSAQFGKKLLAKAQKGQQVAGKGGSNATPLDFSSSRMWPAVTAYSLLDNSCMSLSVDGKLKMSWFDMAFLPPTDENGSVPNYNGFKEADMILYAEVVEKKSADVKGRFYYTVTPLQQPISTVSLSLGARSDNLYNEIQLAEGAYDLKFYGTGTHFYTFPFEVIKKESADAYAAMPEVYFLKGPWEEWAYLTVPDGNGDANVTFHWYMDNTDPNVENASRPNKWKEAKYHIELKKGGTLIGFAASSEFDRNGYKSLELSRGKWTNSNTLFHSLARLAKGDSHDLVQMQDLSDGIYEFHLKTIEVDGSNGAKVFKVEKKNGRFINHPNADRKQYKDKFTLMESGPEYVFIKRK